MLEHFPCIAQEPVQDISLRSQGVETPKRRCECCAERDLGEEDPAELAVVVRSDAGHRDEFDVVRAFCAHDADVSVNVRRRVLGEEEREVAEEEGVESEVDEVEDADHLVWPLKKLERDGEEREGEEKLGRVGGKAVVSNEGEDAGFDDEVPVDDVALLI